MIIFAIDPGPVKSAWCHLNADYPPLIIGEHIPNAELLKMLGDTSVDHYYAIEMVASYGMSVGKSVFETCVWIGRFYQALASRMDAEPTLIYRKDVKMNLCGQMKATDSNIRTALIDRFGAPGTKKFPGPTYGISGDVWSALAVAVTAGDKLGLLTKSSPQLQHGMQLHTEGV